MEESFFKWLVIFLFLVFIAGMIAGIWLAVCEQPKYAIGSFVTSIFAWVIAYVGAQVAKGSVKKSK